MSEIIKNTATRASFKVIGVATGIGNNFCKLQEESSENFKQSCDLLNGF